MPDPAELKRCRGHGREPHLEHPTCFAANRRTRDGLQKLCRGCHKSAMKASRVALKATPREVIEQRQSLGVKRCARCARLGRNPNRPMSDFYKASDTYDGKRAHCKDCVRELRWISYGIVGMTVDKYEQMLQQQEFKCAIPSCPSIGTDERSLDVDHNHTNGEVRGLLCKACNIALGKTRESVQILSEMIVYLAHAAM